MSNKSELKGIQKLFFGAFVLFLLIHFIVSLGNSNSGSDNNIVYVEKNYASDGLDLEAVLELSKNVSDPKALEEELNSPDGINNLDLNEDGYIDYIYVTEYGDEEYKGLSLSVKPTEQEEQEIATLEFVQNDNEVEMEAKGNEQIYGHNHYYHSRVTLGDIILFNYLFSPHRYWVSPFYYGYHNYPRYRTVSYTSYRTRTARYTSGSTSKAKLSPSLKSNISSPNKSKAATSVKAKLKNPTTSQKSFQVKNTRKVKSGGFGKKTSTSVRKTSFSSGGSGGK